MRWLLVLMVGTSVYLGVPLDTESRERLERVIVRDYTASAVVAETVTDFNRIMPRRGPRLVYRAMPRADCRTLTICVDPGLIEFAGIAGRAAIVLNAAYVDHENTVCHEFMHVLARVPDAYDSNPDSCVYGQLDDPGGADIQMLREHYRKKDRR
jgi:hypothetical protein